MNNFWKKQNKPILALAPMAGVTDAPFRIMCREYGADVLYSEMGSVTALVYAPEKTLELLTYNPELESPYVVQLFGSDPDHFAQATKIVTEKIKPQGIDINFGCPVKKIQKQGAGAVLMRDMKLARDCIKATIDNTDLPVSIKTRAKVDDVNVLQFLEFVSSLDIKALMIHGRTLAQGFSGPIDTEIIKKARDYFGGPIMANGGINTPADAQKILEKTQVDGLGIARGSMGKPWLFEDIKKSLENQSYSEKGREEIFAIAMKHSELMRKLKGDGGMIEMRKHLCWYMHGMPGAAEMRQRMVGVNTLDDIKEILSL